MGYEYIFEFLEDAQHCTVGVERTPEERQKRKDILNQLYNRADWIKRFQEGQMRKGNNRILDGNIYLPCGFSMLHAAIILSDERVAIKVMEVGPKEMTICSKHGSPLELSRKLYNESLGVDEYVTNAQNIISSKLYQANYSNSI